MPDDKLTPEVVDAIIAHNNNLISACDINMLNLQRLPKAMRTEQVEGQLKYWEHCRAGLKWSNTIARQRRQRPNNVNG